MSRFYLGRLAFMLTAKKAVHAFILYINKPTDTGLRTKARLPSE